MGMRHRTVQELAEQVLKNQTLRTLQCGPTERDLLTLRHIDGVWHWVGIQHLIKIVCDFLLHRKVEIPGRDLSRLSAYETTLAVDVASEIQRRTIVSSPQFANLRAADKAFGSRWKIPEAVMARVMESRGD